MSEQNNKSNLLKILKPLASLQLTVVLFVLSLVLVFAGTLAQVDNPIWTAVSDYFRSFYVFIPNQVFARFCQTFRWVSPTAQWPGSFPFPGGWTIGGLMLANLLAAHAVRFKFSTKRIGIISVHAGIILLMLGELITGIFAVEGNMTIEQGGVTNYLELKETSGFMGKVNGPELAPSELTVTIISGQPKRPTRTSAMIRPRPMKTPQNRPLIKISPRTGIIPKSEKTIMTRKRKIAIIGQKSGAEMKFAIFSRA